MSCGHERGQCVEFSKKAKRNNGICVLHDLRAAARLVWLSAFRDFASCPIADDTLERPWEAGSRVFY
jgi:hypothetical protein